MSAPVGCVSMEHRAEGWAGRIELGPHTLHVSQLPGEVDWTVDATYATVSGRPVHVNGFGARYLRTSVIAVPEATAALNAAVEKAAEEANRIHWAAVRRVGDSELARVENALLDAQARIPSIINMVREARLVISSNTAPAAGEMPDGDAS